MKKLYLKITSFLEKYEFISIRKNNGTLIFMSACIILGITLGCCAVRIFNMEVFHRFDFLFLDDFKVRMAQSASEIFASSYSSSFLFIIIMELFAASFWGVALIPAAVMFRGFGMGVAAGYLYFIYGLKGIAFYILILLPGMFVSSVGMVLCASCAFGFSKKYAKKLLPKAGEERLWTLFKSQIKKSGYCMIVFAFSAFLDMAFMMMFSRFFDF